MLQNHSLDYRPTYYSYIYLKIVKELLFSVKYIIVILFLGKYEVTEVQIIQELLYCFQGIEGNILRSDGDNGFKLDPLVTWQMLTLHDVEQCFPTFFTMHDKVVMI